MWGGRPGPVATLPALREVDLYSFQVPQPSLAAVWALLWVWGGGGWAFGQGRLAAMGYAGSRPLWGAGQRSSSTTATTGSLIAPLSTCCIASTHTPKQGLDKLENRSLYPEQAAAWASHPANFEIDGHAPVGGRTGGLAWLGVSLTAWPATRLPACLPACLLPAAAWTLTC